MSEQKAGIYGDRVFAVAPMIDWTDTACRFLHRSLSKRALLYTEMIVADAIIHGKRDRLLGYDDTQHPVALQIGGSDPAKLEEAARIALDFGYDEINLNVGCPSDRVQSGTFGACLMLTPDVVEAGVAALRRASGGRVPVTVKCRIGVDDQEPGAVLPDFLRRMIGAGVDAVWIHARKAWLKGLSPRENREIPPLDYDLVYRMKAENPNLFIGINGGVQDVNQALEHLNHVDGVMLGRAAYHNALLLTEIDHRIFGDPQTPLDRDALRDRMMAYAEGVMAAGGRLNHVTRHMVGLFHGAPGARRFRQILSSDATAKGAGPDVIATAFAALEG